MRKAAAKTREPRQKLQEILRHSAVVFSEKGYEGASIRDISRASGVSLAGLYYYVKSKQELLYLIQIYTFKTILARLEERLAGTNDPEERLRALVLNHLEYFLSNPVEMKVLTHEDDALAGRYRAEVLEIKRRYFALAAEIFEELRKAGRARRVNSRVAVLSLFGMMNWVHTWHRPQVDPEAKPLAESMAGVFLNGVLNGAAAKPESRRDNGRARRAGEARAGAGRGAETVRRAAENS
jgi:TetR/AcrR family transcriptional regulator, cholesterol catabolism regulator